jgi:hypothetical protein
LGVFGSSGFDDPLKLFELLVVSADFCGLAAARRLPITNRPADLRAVDARLSDLVADPWLGPSLTNELALLLGSVLVRHVSGARWCVLENGQPVVRLRHGEDVDVVDRADHRIKFGEPSLHEVFMNAHRRTVALGIGDPRPGPP